MDFEFFETPDTFTRYLFRSVTIAGTIYEPCVGNGAIVRASGVGHGYPNQWLTNDLDPRWPADTQLDATVEPAWHPGGDGIDWTVSNPPFTQAVGIITPALRVSRIGVAMHLRISIHEVLKEGPRRTWFNEHPPTGILFLPRFAYQRSKKTGVWTQDSACACWVIWLKDDTPQFIRYAPVWVIDELQAETKTYRERMDALMGYTGTEVERRAQRRAA